ncbi:polyprenyl synthetase family protein [Arthrobacter sulfonylureivorans]|uniref:polyprenyl synthetase family protein n=1 Tax=Arthrobacter sulfonylureivorans TaxID=2486855 RepID=UPI0039E50499
MTANTTSWKPAPTQSNNGSWTRFSSLVEAELLDFVDKNRAQAGKISQSFPLMWDHIESALQGGKRLRPRMVHLAYTAFNGVDPHRCARMAAAFELLHTALVVHDDAIDRDFVRRGQPTIGAHYRDHALAQGLSTPDAEHFGHSASIIAGDLLLAGALRLAGRAAAGLPQDEELTDTMHDAVFASAAGELEDVLLSVSTDRPDLQDVLEMESLKTAGYSFEAPLKAGALLAGVDPGQAEALAAIGRRIGVAYQIVDDVLGTFGEPDTTGKSAESDLREGKRTVLTAFAAEADGFDDLLAAFRRGEAEADQVRAALKDCGADTRAQDLARSLVDEALQESRRLPLHAAARANLEAVCLHVLTRGN